VDTEKEFRRLVIDLANLKPDSSAMQALRDKYDLGADLSDTRVLFLRDLGQRLWGGGDEGGIEILRQVLLPEDGLAMVEIDWRLHGLTYQPQTTIQGGFYYLLQNAHLAKRCGNTQCPRPFFFAKRANERYCSERCFAQAQRAAKKDWWGEHREEFRKSRSKQ
jgi:hypothetical protein